MAAGGLLHGLVSGLCVCGGEEGLASFPMCMPGLVAWGCVGSVGLALVLDGSLGARSAVSSSQHIAGVVSAWLWPCSASLVV